MVYFNLVKLSLIMWQIALQLVRQAASDEPVVADQMQSPTDGPAVADVELADTDKTQAEAVDKFDQSMVASKNQIAAEMVEGNAHVHSPETSGEGVVIQTDLPGEPALAEVQVSVTDEYLDSKVCNKL